MKNRSLVLSLQLITSIMLTSAGAFACLDGQCMDKTGYFTDALSFSRASSCPTFSNDQALMIAGEALDSRISYSDLKRAYSVSCDLNVSMNVANRPGQSVSFVEIIQMSRSSSCPTLSPTQALQVSGMVVSKQIGLRNFENAYSNICELQNSLQVAGNSNDTNMMVDLLQFSRATSCPTLSSNQILNVLREIDSSHVDFNSFKNSYAVTCSLQASLAAASSPQKSSIVDDVISFSKASSCPTLSSTQALQISNLVLSGTIDFNDFKSAYNSSCNLDVSISASRCTTR